MKSIEFSPFYRLQKKSSLATLLRVALKEITKMVGVLNTNPHQYYNVFKTYDNPTKSRLIEEPLGNLKKIHSRIKNLLMRTETPEWLISGKKGKSIVDNALPHLTARFVTCVDIEKFYKSTSKERILQTFLYTFKTSSDVARLLTNLIMYHDVKADKYFVPTGSPCSQIVAFWAYYHTFMDIADYVSSLGIKMTLYVDDLTLSFDKRISRQVITNLNNRLKSVGLSLKLSKIKVYGPSQYKTITGNCITPNNKLIPTRKLRKEISEAVRNKKLKDLSIGELRRINGKISATHQQDPNTFRLLQYKIQKLLQGENCNN